jgi:prophage regulatory protein
MYNDSPGGLDMGNSILRLPTVKERTGLSRSEIYRRIRLGEFPKQVPLGPRSVGWAEAEIDAWIAKAISRARKAA